jgi:serine/threonine protein kinase
MIINRHSRRNLRRDKPKNKGSKEDSKESDHTLLEGKFKIKKKISQGGFGKVYLAKDLINKKEVVVKINAEVEMNGNEFDIMKDMSDSEIAGFPEVYSSGMIKGQPYIIQEKLGLSIKDILKRNNRHFSLICIISIGIQLIDLMEKFHDKGYIHCDIKPDNIMIGDYMRDQKLMNKLYLIDFGIS